MQWADTGGAPPLSSTIPTSGSTGTSGSGGGGASPDAGPLAFLKGLDLGARQSLCLGLSAVLIAVVAAVLGAGVNTILVERNAKVSRFTPWLAVVACVPLIALSGILVMWGTPQGESAVSAFLLRNGPVAIVMFFASIYFMRWYTRAVEDQKKEHDEAIKSKDAIIAARDATIVGKDEIIAGKDSVISGKDSIIGSKDAERAAGNAAKDEVIAAKDTIIAGKDNTIRAKDELVASKDGIISAKNAEHTSVVAAKDEIIAGKDGAIKAKDEIIANKVEIIANKDSVIGAREAEYRALLAKRDAERAADRNADETRTQERLRELDAAHEKIAALEAEKDNSEQDKSAAISVGCRSPFTARFHVVA
jgi:ABC-type nickel/cobalt efflux system permease component RcnA